MQEAEKLQTQASLRSKQLDLQEQLQLSGQPLTTAQLAQAALQASEASSGDAGAAAAVAAVEALALGAEQKPSEQYRCGAGAEARYFEQQRCWSGRVLAG